MRQNNGFGHAGGNSSGNRYGGFSGTGGGSFGGGGGGGYPTSFGGRSEGYGNAGSNLSTVQWDQVKMHQLKKDIYHEHAAVSRRDQSEIDKWITENQVTLQGKNIPRPLFEFKEANFPGSIENLLLANYTKPTPIQSISWPVAMSGRDIISIAKTGSGKTLGFLLPGILHTVSQVPRSGREGPTVLVILPTRELAQQVEEVARDYCKVMNLGLTCLFGGAAKGVQAGNLRRGIDICVATPGRLLDFIQDGTTNMNRVSYLVLDEADRMLDMGFEPQIRKIVSQVRPDRQTLMFSASWPREVRNLASDFQKDAVYLNVGSLELSANHKIKQHVEVVEDFAKRSRLYQLLKEIMAEPDHKTIIFVATKKVADYLTQEMRRGGFPAFALHGGKAQRERDWVMAEFRASRAKILIATDVAARGLDLDDIKVVINYDYPNDAEDYVHRIGRTARGGKKGISYTFFSSKDGANRGKAQKLISVLEEAKQDVPQALKQFLNGHGGGKGGSNYGYNRNGASGAKRSYGSSAHQVSASKKTRFDDHGSSFSHSGRGHSHTSHSGGGQAARW